MATQSRSSGPQIYDASGAFIPQKQSPKNKGAIFTVAAACLKYAGYTRMRVPL